MNELENKKWFRLCWGEEEIDKGLWQRCENHSIQEVEESIEYYENVSHTHFWLEYR